MEEAFFRYYPEKVWGITTDKMLPDWAPKRIEFRNKVTPFYHNQWNAVGKYGTGSIYKRIEESILNQNGEILFNKTLTKIDKKNNKIISLRFDDNTNVTINPEDIVIIVSYCDIEHEALKGHKPFVVHVDDDNKIINITSDVLSP